MICAGVDSNPGHRRSAERCPVGTVVDRSRGIGALGAGTLCGAGCIQQSV